MPGQVSWLLIELRKKLGCCAFSVRFSGVARQDPTYRAKPAYPSPRGGGSQEGCWGRLSLPCRCAAVHLQLARVPRPAGPLVQLVFRLSGNTVCRRGAGPAGGSSLRMCLWRAVERRYFRTLPVLTGIPVVVSWLCWGDAGRPRRALGRWRGVAPATAHACSDLTDCNML